MALRKTIQTNSRVTVPDAYIKIFRTETRHAGLKKVFVNGEGERVPPPGPGREEEDHDLVEQMVPDVTGEIQLLTYSSKAAADEDAPPVMEKRYRLDLSDVTPEVVAEAKIGNPLVTVDDCLALMNAINYRALKARYPELADATDV